MNQIYCLLLMALTGSFILSGCADKSQGPLFTSLSSTESGIDFINTIDETAMSGDALNEFAYMGGGVGVLDVNNDGLKDLFFTGNQVSGKLYLNKGNNQFEDITMTAGVSTSDWITGVSIVDINGDGYDDIYLCTYGKTLGTRSPNLLFINQQDNTFKEQALTYGLADTSYATQAVFFDFDKDGDLDMYLSNYLLNVSYSANYLFPKNLTGRSPANDKLYRNEGTDAIMGHPVFMDVSEAAGIKEDGYGLGVSVCDFNQDGWPDIYVCNDFVSNDNFWLNNRDGTFTNVIERATKHQSYSSMGGDAADVNNDLKFDFASVDMMPEDNYRKKQSFSFMTYERYQEERRLGYAPQFSRNMLQLNIGNHAVGDTSLPFFSEIGQLAGISETDWSWSILFADFNNDGFKDVHITNGIGRDFINADFINYSQTVAQEKTQADMTKILKEKLGALKHVELSNYLYLSKGDYTFSNAGDSSGLGEKSMSNGAAYVDLDNDGDLDLVVNNINKPAFILINNQNQPGKIPQNHSIGFVLQGAGLNTRGLGAKVFVYTGGMAQVQEQFPVRGYLSSVDTKLIFGLGKEVKADSVIIVWPDNQKEIKKDLSADSVYILQQKDANQIWQPANVLPEFSIFKEAAVAFNVEYKHTDVIYDDYADQRFLPQKYSQQGPFIATGDVDRDGRTDFYIGGGFNAEGKFFMQDKNGTFTGKEFVVGTKFQEDMESVLFDANGDGHPDLLITYGDMRYSDTSQYYRPRLYLNDGKGNFVYEEKAIPKHVRTIAGAVAVADYDGDGYADVFIGGRVSKQYPSPPNSYLLKNKKGSFIDVTQEVCPALSKAGMVTAAQWADIDNDSLPDLVLTGEYMPVKFFSNNGKKLLEVTGETGLENMNGLWRSLLAKDVDGDGDIDFIVGNMGTNNPYNVSPAYPMQLYADDIDRNGKIIPVMFYFIKDEEGRRKLFPSVNLDKLSAQAPLIKKKFLLNIDYARATPDDIYKNSGALQILTCEEMRSGWLENLGNGKFIMHPLPMEAQFAPVNAIICEDLDGDGIKDILIAGNEYQTEVMAGRHDASYGLFLKGSKGKEFKALAPSASGFIVQGDVKNMKLLTTEKNEKLVLVSVNDDYMKVFRIMQP